MARRRGYRWAQWPREKLLDLRLCDLKLEIEGSWLEEPIDQLKEEIQSRGLRVRPHFWLSEEWFCPDGVPGIALPFYLAHPRLTRLQRQLLNEVEGGTHLECMKLLRHETGHVMQQAYRLHQRRSWQRIFGRNSQPYPDYYLPRRDSRRFVRHLGYWYAQSHPIEDFAETFAVWLTPRSGWRRRYRDWPAFKKLEYVDELMEELAGERPRVTSRERTDCLSRLRITLREHYEERLERYGAGFPPNYDNELLRIFVNSGAQKGQAASAFLRRHRSEIRRQVAQWVPDDVYAVDHVLNEMIGRCRELGLRVVGSERRVRENFSVLLAVTSMRCLYRSRDWHAM